MNSIGTFNCNVYFTRYALLQRKNELWPTKNKDCVRILNLENWFLAWAICNSYLNPSELREEICSILEILVSSFEKSDLGLNQGI